MLEREELALLLEQQESERRRSAEQTRQGVLKAVVETPETQGRVPGELSMEGLSAAKNGGEEAKWTTDIQALVAPDVDPWAFLDGLESSSPYKETLLAQACRVVLQVIGGNYGEDGLRVFLDWLDSSVTEVAEKYESDPGEMLQLIKQMVAACRVAAGMRNTDFNFPAEVAEVEEFLTLH